MLITRVLILTWIVIGSKGQLYDMQFDLVWSSLLVDTESGIRPYVKSCASR